MQQKIENNGDFTIMLIEVLGSGGAMTIPKPLCNCRICQEARDKGIPYSRSGPSVFLYGLDVLIDTPEEIKDQLNKSQTKNINACFYSHWHPDHLMGLRVWNINKEWVEWPTEIKPIKIYLPEQVYYDMRNKLGILEYFRYYEKRNLIELVHLKDGQVVTMKKTIIKPFRLKQDYVYGFLLSASEGKRILIVMDELFGWKPDGNIRNVDLAIIPMGIQEINPITKKRQIHINHPVLKKEATFEQTLEIVKKLNAKRVIMLHISEHDGLSFDDFKILQEDSKIKALNIEFAYDHMLINI